MSFPTREIACSSKLRGVWVILAFWDSIISFACCGVRKFGVSGVWEEFCGAIESCFLDSSLRSE